MRTTIDSAGRMVVPKPLRDALGVRAGQEVDVQLRDGRLEIQLPPTPMRLVGRGGSTVVRPDRPLPPLSAAQVRETLEQTRR